jgi:hypothetical protein
MTFMAYSVSGLRFVFPIELTLLVILPVLNGSVELSND